MTAEAFESWDTGYGVEDNRNGRKKATGRHWRPRAINNSSMVIQRNADLGVGIVLAVTKRSKNVSNICS